MVSGERMNRFGLAFLGIYIAGLLGFFRLFLFERFGSACGRGGCMLLSWAAKMNILSGSR